MVRDWEEVTWSRGSVLMHRSVQLSCKEFQQKDDLGTPRPSAFYFGRTEQEGPPQKWSLNSSLHYPQYSELPAASCAIHTT